jgi:hypothetical protein
VLWLKVPPKVAVIVIEPYVAAGVVLVFVMDKLVCALPLAETETGVATLHVAFVGQPEVTVRATLPEKPFTDDTVTV